MYRPDVRIAVAVGNYLVVTGTIVTNRVRWDSVVPWTPPAGTVVYEDVNNNVKIGWIRKPNGTFIAP